MFPIRSEDVLDWDEETDEWNHPCATTGADAYSINIWSTAYKRDFSPFIDKTTRGDVCACPACTEHTRAYVHHLLQAHEMTSQVLLEAHNLYHLVSFFAEARESVARRDVDALCDVSSSLRRVFAIRQNRSDARNIGKK